MGHSICKSHTVCVVAMVTYLHCNLEVIKVLSKIAKASGCETIAEWIKPCQNYHYWSARATCDGNGEVYGPSFHLFLAMLSMNMKIWITYCSINVGTLLQFSHANGWTKVTCICLYCMYLLNICYSKLHLFHQIKCIWDMNRNMTAYTVYSDRNLNAWKT